MRCTYCGTDLPEAALFCGECGRSVTPASTSASTSATRRTPAISLPPFAPAFVLPHIPQAAAPVSAPGHVAAGVDKGDATSNELLCEQCNAQLETDEVFCGRCGSVSERAARQLSQSRETVVLERIDVSSRSPLVEVDAVVDTGAVVDGEENGVHPASVESSVEFSVEFSDERPPSAAPPVPLPRPPVAPFEESDDLEATRISRPRLGERFVLQFSTGESSTVHGNGLIGRNPVSEPGEYFDQMVRVIDPSRSVSKTHVEFGQEGGSFWVLDRSSGNGTIVREPETAAVRCRPERRYRVARGTRIDIGEQFFVVS